MISFPTIGVYKNEMAIRKRLAMIMNIICFIALEPQIINKTPKRELKCL